MKPTEGGSESRNTEDKTAPDKQAVNLHADAERRKQIEEIMQAMPNPEDEKSPWMAFTGLAVAIIGWILLFVLPDGDLSVLTTQLYVILGIGLASLLLCIFGRKRAMGISLVGMIVSAALMLFAIIGLVVMALT